MTFMEVSAVEISDIIQFITKNFFFVVLILGFLASMFSKSKKAGKQPGRMPDFGGAGTGMGRPKSYPQASQPSRDDERGQYAYPTSSESVYEEPAKPAVMTIASAPSKRQSPMTDSMPSRAALVASAKGIDSAYTINAEKDRKHVLELSSRDEIAKAVLMAEILGPPRARKPFRR